jgi:hypothetical protein
MAVEAILQMDHLTENGTFIPDEVKGRLLTIGKPSR